MAADANTAGSLSHEGLRELAGTELDQPILSVICRTDPREPANRNQTPAWLIEARNGLRDLEERLNGDGGNREHRLAVRDLAGEIPTRIQELGPDVRGRSLALYVTPDRRLDRLETLHLPVRRDAVVWDRRPFISPLIDVLDRGRNTGLVLVGGERIRLAHIEQGMLEEPDESVFELELGDWRRYEAYAMANPARGQQSSTNDKAFEQRVGEWRERFFQDAARATAERLPELDWDRVLIAAEGQFAAAFSRALPEPLAEKVIAELDLNLVDHPHHEIDEALEPRLDELWLSEATGAAESAVERARAGGPAALGADETLAALAERRVEHLVLDPLAVNGATELGPEAREVAGDAEGEMLAERAIEAGYLSGARVTSLDCQHSEPLREAGGIAALLRY